MLDSNPYASAIAIVGHGMAAKGAKTSHKAPPEIADELGADLVIEGSIVRTDPANPRPAVSQDHKEGASRSAPVPATVSAPF